MKGYSTNDIAELLGMEASLIRDIARAGILSPERVTGNQYRFSFQDIIVLRTAKELLNAGMKRSQVNSTLYQLKARLPSNRSLTSLRIAVEGGDLVVQEADKVYNPVSGQIHFNFSVAELAGTVAPLARQAVEEAESRDHLSPDDWFDLGVDLEAVSPADAPTAYLRALALDPSHSDAHVNLGRLLQEEGNHRAAEEHYQLALKADPDNALATFNLGTLYEDLGRIEDAIHTYKQVTNLADAHYNLSRLYEMIGEPAQALKHLKVYKNLLEPH